MKCCSQCAGIERQFDQETASEELDDYRRQGLAGTSRTLVEALVAAGVTGATLLDIGGGVGAVQHALLDAGAASAVHVDASSAYLQAAETEAEHRGLSDRIRFRHGDFVSLAAEVAPADVVTLDRVICCYHDMPALVEASAARAQRLYGLVYPRDAWWIRVGSRFANVFLWLQRTPFRIFVHPTNAVDAIVRRQGFHLQVHRRTWFWQVVVYERQLPADLQAKPLDNANHDRL